MPESSSRKVTVVDDSGISEVVTTTNLEASNSSEIGVNAKGEVSIKVKVYGLTPDTVVRESHRATLDLAALFNLTIKGLNPNQEG